jgi:ABC-type bacteriocin/lantibiotic exporter with double-glycine peptidase domain
VVRRQLGVVLQENILFNRSIRDNIALAEPGMPIDRVIAAATLAGAHDFVLEPGFHRRSIRATVVVAVHPLMNMRRNCY